MMVKKVMKYFKVFAIVIMVTYVIIGFSIQHTPQSLQKETQLGKPYLFEKNTEYFGVLSDYATCDNTLYVLYEAKGILKCYDLSGNYLYSYCFFAHQNGRAELQRTSKELYLKDRQNNYYQVSNGEVIRFLHWEQNANEIKLLEKSFVSDSQKRTDVQGNTYTLRGAVIWKTDPNGSQTQIIHRPWILQFVSLKYLAISHFVCMILLAISLLYEKFGRN